MSHAYALFIWLKTELEVIKINTKLIKNIFITFSYMIFN